MRSLLTFIFCVFLFSSCKEANTENSKEKLPDNQITYKSYGKKFDFNKDLTEGKSQSEIYEITSGDSINTQITAKVNSVCQAKGCWMKLDLDNGHELMVKFKDYGFFVPKDIAGKDVVINGKAYVSEVSVKEQQHYAQDAGKSETEIQTITKPKKTYAFEADGVAVLQ